MFTGIIEDLGEVVAIKEEGLNLTFQVKSTISSELKVDQSIAHNGVCLTVIKVDGNTHFVTAIDETLKKTQLNSLKIGTKLNLERCLRMDARLDGHMVYGHVDQIAKLKSVEEVEGSRVLSFEFEPSEESVIVEKGSICLNGISLTVFDVTDTTFKVAIIPYTWEHTNLHALNLNDFVNLEFDILGKYILKLHKKISIK